MTFYALLNMEQLKSGLKQNAIAHHDRDTLQKKHMGYYVTTVSYALSFCNPVAPFDHDTLHLTNSTTPVT